MYSMNLVLPTDISNSSCSFIINEGIIKPVIAPKLNERLPNAVESPLC
jgi:hypothetical protein